MNGSSILYHFLIHWAYRLTGHGIYHYIILFFRRQKQLGSFTCKVTPVCVYMIVCERSKCVLDIHINSYMTLLNHVGIPSSGQFTGFTLLSDYSNILFLQFGLCARTFLLCLVVVNLC